MNAYIGIGDEVDIFKNGVLFYPRWKIRGIEYSIPTYEKFVKIESPDGMKIETIELLQHPEIKIRETGN